MSDPKRWMLLKCCTQYTSKVGKLSSVHKGLFFIPTPKNSNAKECSNYSKVVAEWYDAGILGYSWFILQIYSVKHILIKHSNNACEVYFPQSPQILMSLSKDIFYSFRWAGCLLDYIPKRFLLVYTSVSTVWVPASLLPSLCYQCRYYIYHNR